MTIYHECESAIEKSVQMNGDHEIRIFLSHLHTNNGFFLTLNLKHRTLNL